MNTVYVVNTSNEKDSSSSEVAASTERALSAMGVNIKLATSMNLAALTKFERACRKLRSSPLLGHELLFKYIEHVRKAEDFGTIMVTDAEIMVGFPPRLTDGVAFPYFGFSTVSLSNMRNQDRLLFHERWEKLLLHEIGHLNGLGDHVPRVGSSRFTSRLSRTVQKDIELIDCVMMPTSDYSLSLLPRPARSGLTKVNGVPIYDLRPKHYCDECRSQFEEVEGKGANLVDRYISSAFFI